LRFIWIVCFLTYSLRCLYKRKQALLGSTLSGIIQMTYKNVNIKSLFSKALNIFRSPYAFKNPFINFILREMVNPL
jgi:hypothetical protein